MVDDRDILNQEIVSELLRDARKANREDQQIVDALQRLLASGEWKLYMDRIVGKRIQSLGELLLEPSGSTDGMVRSEFLKGALYGLCLARDLAGVIVASTRQDIHPRSERSPES
jgi:hypothetical protein